MLQENNQITRKKTDYIVVLFASLIPLGLIACVFVGSYHIAYKLTDLESLRSLTIAVVAALLSAWVFVSHNKHNKKEIQNQLKTSGKLGTKSVILDELNAVIPGTTAKNQDMKALRQKYVDKPKSE